MMYALGEHGSPVRAEPTLRQSGCVCPSCRGEVIAHCGPIVSWHWAHRAADCDPWSEPETQWHLDWKAEAVHVEVPIERNGARHRADIVTPSGTVVELQSTYLSAAEILEREIFYGRIVWLYRVHWAERLHWGRKGFWWKHGAKSMATHRRPVYWDFGEDRERKYQDRVYVVTLGRSPSGRVLGQLHPGWPSAESFAARVLRGEGR